MELDVSGEILRGMTPPSIARQADVPLEEVLANLDGAIGAGLLRRFNVYFSMDAYVRERVELTLSALTLGVPDSVRSDTYVKPICDRAPFLDQGDVLVCLRYGPMSRHYGELYELLREFELGLHGFLKQVLVGKLGAGREGWWLQGVPQQVRSKCAMRSEEIGQVEVDLWKMTDLLDLWDVMEKQWKVFGQLFRAPDTPGKRELASDFRRINEVRNRVMHPVRETPPEEDDFSFVAIMVGRLEAARRAGGDVTQECD